LPEPLEVIAAELEEGPTGKALKVLELAKEHGWYENPHHSFVIRFTRDDAQPIFARWDVGVTATGRISYRFQGARAMNGQPMNYNDLLIALEDPEVLYPEPPGEEGESNDCTD
jgi:hypothetical protein